uniref:Uncharacterized protein n=1 Tax=Anguilla anguilla TaxID=7936 RepID=A0A0E9U8H3_ANGAN
MLLDFCAGHWFFHNKYHV